MKKSKQERVMKQYLKMADVIDGFVLTSGVRCVTIGGSEQQSSAFILAVDSKTADYTAHAINSHDELVQMNQELLAALEEGRRAIGEHLAPYDCYATGPVTGDAFRDLVQCPACSFIAMHDDAIAKAEGGAA